MNPCWSGSENILLYHVHLNQTHQSKDFSQQQVEVKIKEKAKIRNRHNQEPHQTQDTVWKSDKNTRKHHIQEVSPLPAGDLKAARETDNTESKDKHK